MSNRGRLRMEIESFGPIASGSFELRPLTLFLGRDNTGKSCAAALAHSTVRAARNGILSPRALEEAAGSATAQALADRLFSSEGLQEAVLGQLWRSFSGEDLSGLISWFSTEGKARIRVCSSGSGDEWIRIEGDGPCWSVRGRAPRLPDREGRQRIAGVSADELRRIHRLVAEAMGLPEDSHYLPAARLGALQGWRALAAEAARRGSRWAGVEEGPALGLPGLVGEFLEGLVRASKGLGRPQGGESASPFRSALEVLERDVLGGHGGFLPSKGASRPRDRLPSPGEAEEARCPDMARLLHGRGAGSPGPLDQASAQPGGDAGHRGARSPSAPGEPASGRPGLGAAGAGRRDGPLHHP